MAGREHVLGPGHSPVDNGTPAGGGPARQVRLLGAVVAFVVGVDQVVKWLAWRHFDRSLINDGGYFFLGPVIRSWFAGPVSGAIADVLGLVLVALGIGWLLRRSRPPFVLVGGGLVSAGWLSNLLDRLGLHTWTAPGSARGVVDFIPSGGPSRCNVADLLIVAGTLLLGYAIARRRLSDGPRDRPRPTSLPRHEGARVRVAAVIVLLAVLIVAVASARNHDGAYSPKGWIETETAPSSDAP